MAYTPLTIRIPLKGTLLHHWLNARARARADRITNEGT